MWVYNKGKRSFRVNRSDVIDAPPPVNEGMANSAYVHSGITTEVTDECGDKLIRMYPKEIIETISPQEERKLRAGREAKSKAKVKETAKTKKGK